MVGSCHRPLAAGPGSPHLAAGSASSCTSAHPVSFGYGPACRRHLASPAENDFMPDTNTPLRRDDADDAEARSDEVRMRLALEKLGTRSTPPVRSRPGRSAGSATHTAAPRRHKFAREGEVPVERLPPPVRSAGDLQRELAEERAARQRAEQTLNDAKAAIATLQAAHSRSEQVARAAREAVEEREAAMAGLRAELRRLALKLEAATDAKPATRAGVKCKRGGSALTRPKRVQAASQAPTSQPVKWWLALTQPRT